MLFVGVVNHWVTLVAHRPDPKNLTNAKMKKKDKGVPLVKLYLMDSTNMPHLAKESAVVPEVIMDRVK